MSLYGLRYRGPRKPRAIPYHAAALCCQHTHDDRAHLFISSHHTYYIHGGAITCLLVTLTVLLVTAGGDILACLISTRAAFICRAFTGIIILCTKVGWGAFRMQCLDFLLQDFDVQRAACLRGRKKTTPPSNTSPKPTAAQNSANRSVNDSRENWDSSGKWPNKRVRHDSDPVHYGMTSQLRCVWASRTKKSS